MHNQDLETTSSITAKTIAIIVAIERTIGQTRKVASMIEKKGRRKREP